MEKELKTFDDLQFYPHEAGSGMHAVMNFHNGYGVSVLCGKLFYSNGIDTYEVGILYDGNLTYSTEITSDVLGGLTRDEVTEVMEKVQKL